MQKLSDETYQNPDLKSNLHQSLSYSQDDFDRLRYENQILKDFNTALNLINKLQTKKLNKKTKVLHNKIESLMQIL